MNNLQKDAKKWLYILLGASIGAGILFIPIQAGISGFWPTLVAIIIAFPLIYFAKKYVTLILLKSTTNGNGSYTAALGSYFSKHLTKLFALIYFLFLFVAVLAYSTGLNTNVANYLKTHFYHNIEFHTNPLFIAILLAILISFMIFTEHFLLKLLEKLSLILMILLVVLMIAFIPFWNLSIITHFSFSFIGFLKSFMLIFPILLFSATFFPTISPMVSYFQKNYDHLDKKEREGSIHRVIFIATIILGVFIGFFVLSSVLALSATNLKFANLHNLSSLAIIGRGSHSFLFLSITKYVGLAVTLIALVTSYYGISFGLIEVLTHKFKIIKKSEKANRNLIIIVLNAFFWFFITFNFNILGLLGRYMSPCIGLFLFLLPAYAILKSEKLKKHRSWLVIVIVIFGAFLLVSYSLGTII